MINGELESRIDLNGDTDPAEGWPTVTQISRARSKKKKSGKMQTGRIVAGVRLVPSDTHVEAGSAGAAQGAGAGGVGDLVRWPGIGSLFGVGGGWGNGAAQVEVRVYVVDARGLAAEDTNRKSDAYLQLSLAGQVQDTRTNTRYVQRALLENCLVWVESVIENHARYISSFVGNTPVCTESSIEKTLGICRERY